MPTSWLLAALLILTPSVRGQEAQAIDTEIATKVKAAYLFQFTRFVRWPAASFGDADSPIVIGVLGEDPFGRILEATVAGEKVRGRHIDVRRIAADESLPVDAGACHVLFVSPSVEPGLDALLAAWSDASVLTVSDVAGFAARGGVVELATEQGRIIFKVNRAAAERAGLKLSARLLRLARIVEPGGGE